MKVVYAHTDSIYVPIESVTKAKEKCDIINSYVKELFPNVMNLENHPVNLEFEKFYKALGVGCTKNRNAGFISWKDGLFLSEPEFVVTGFSMKRISENEISRKFQETLLKMWAGQSTQSEIIEYCKKMYNDVKKGRVPIEKVMKRGRVRKAMDEYKSIAGGIAGVQYYNQHINPTDPINDSFLYIECSRIDGPQYVILPNGRERRANFVSVKEMNELDEKYIPNWDSYAVKSIIQKAKPVFEAMNWDIKLFTIDENQKGLGEWL